MPPVYFLLFLEVIMPPLRTHTSTALVAALIMFVGIIGPAAAEEKSYYSPIIMIDKEKGWLIISEPGSVFAVEASEEAKPHLEKLPVSGMIDVVVETREGKPPLIKSWKVTAGDSSCKSFDGKNCK